MGIEQNRKACINGCLLPIVILLVLLFLAFVLLMAWPRHRKFYIPDLNLYVKMEHRPFHGERNERISFSKDRQCKGDFIEFANHADWCDLTVYYIPPTNLYAVVNVYDTADITKDFLKIEEDYFDIKEVKYVRKDSFVIEYTNDGRPYEFPCFFYYTDSTFIKQPSYRFDVNETSGGFYLWDVKGNGISVEEYQ